MRRDPTASRFGVLGLLLAAACSSARSSAESAVTAADRAVAALPQEAAKVVPDKFGPLADAVNRGREELTGHDYPAALTSVREVPAKAKALAESLPARKAALTAEMDTLAVAMPRNLAAIKAKLDDIAKAKRLPRGLDEQELRAAKDTYAATTAEWGSVTTAFKSGELASAMAKALDLKTRVSRSLMALGLVADERAWSNLTLPTKP